MIKVMTTKATYKGIEIAMKSDNSEHRTTYSCTNNSRKAKPAEQWFRTQREALDYERSSIDASLL